MSSDALKIHNESFDENNIVDEIIGLHEEIRRAAETMIQKAVCIGELLVHQKSKLRHGEFGKWIVDNLPFTVRTAQNYMKVFRNKDQLKNENVSLLSDAYNILKLPRDQFKETGEEKEKRYYITISLDDIQKVGLETAIEKAKEVLGTRSTSESIYYIVYDWFMSYEFTPKRIELQCKNAASASIQKETR